MCKKFRVLFLSIIFISICTNLIPSEDFKILSLRERAEILAELNNKRVNTFLLPAMRKAGIDCWIIMSREYKEDFVLNYIEDTHVTGGHRNAYVIYDDGSDKVKKIAIGTYLPKKSKVWDKILSYFSGEGKEGPSLKPILQKTIEEINPKKIGINQSRTIPMCDGLTVEMKRFLVESIGPEYEKRLVSAEQMIVDFLEQRLPEEMDYFKEAAELTQKIHEEALSNKVITPGKTTTKDVQWHILNRLAELNLDTWFFPIVSITRKGGIESDPFESGSVVIQPGDIVHTDIGIIYVGLYTDYQKNAYVLKPGEIEPPDRIKKAFENSLKVQDAIFRVSSAGKLGYKLKEEAENLCKKWGVDGNVYSHSVGIPGHGIGAMIIPNWPDRYGIRASFPLRLGAYYSIESSATTSIPEWDGQKVTIGTEEDAYLAEDGFKYFIPRQDKLYLIKTIETK